MKSDVTPLVKLIKKYEKVEEEANRLLNHLPDYLKYHNKAHTIDVRNSFIRYAFLERITPHTIEFWAGKTAAMLHDIGYLLTDNGKNHEEKGAEFAESLLESSHYEHENIVEIKGMILSTKLPQTPNTLLEKMICDSDLDNLGRKDFLEKRRLLREELEFMGVKYSDKDWYEGALKFFENHTYHTEVARRLRDERKKKNIEELKKIISSLR